MRKRGPGLGERHGDQGDNLEAGRGPRELVDERQRSSADLDVGGNHERTRDLELWSRLDVLELTAVKRRQRNAALR